MSLSGPMTARPSLSIHSRPLSAIYIGPNPPAHHIPDLPEPPSPGSSSNGSGLPSPPATNSTGSGSTTGGNSTNTGSLRQRPVSLPSTNMTNGTSIKTPTTSFTKNGRLDEEEDEHENDDDEDHTAQLGRQQFHRSSSENVLALQRVKSLTQRNRMALDKLSAFPRLATPSPARNSRSPARPPAAGSSSASSSSKSTSSRLSSHSHARSQSQIQPIQHRRKGSRESGSETERESQHALLSTSASYSSSSEDLNAILTSSIRPQSSLGLHRQRRTSAPVTPAKAISRTISAPSPHTPRTRVLTLGSTESPYTGNGERVRDVTSAALAAVASARLSPTGGSGSGKKRGALPREFTNGRAILDSESLGEPSTPYNKRVPSPNPHISFSTDTALRGSRYSGPSVRELVKRHQARVQSEDMGSAVSGSRAKDDGQAGESEKSGGAESVGRSLVGEGLKAAGILRKKDEDVFGSEVGEEVGLRRAYTGGSYRSRRESVDWASEARTDRTLERERDRSPSRGSEDSRGEGMPPPTPGRLDPQTADITGTFRRSTNRTPYSASRPPTSMTNRRHGGADDESPVSADSPVSRTFTPASILSERGKDRTGALSSLSRHSTSRRYSPLPPVPGSHISPLQYQHTASDHTRLMTESLSIFESHLARLPPMGTTTSVTLPDLFRSAQSVVHASDKLNTLLRAGNNRAMTEQIDAEVRENDVQGTGMANVWRKIGGDYREGVRASDELVRSMTGFLLGVGRVLKETSALAGSSGGDGGHHGRSASLDEEGLRRGSPDAGRSGRMSVEERRSNGRASVEGRRSTEDGRSESRRSWDLAHDTSRGDTIRRLSNRVDGILAGGPRPPSSLKRRDLDAPSPALTGKLSSSTRRLYTPREQREQQLNGNSDDKRVTASESSEALHAYEPSPTPAARRAPTRLPLPDRSRALPPLAIPSPLPTLPSETLARRAQVNLTGDKNPTDRKKLSNTSTSTVRPTTATLSPFPSLTTPNPTTAVTAHTVSKLPDKGSTPLLRSYSGTSSQTGVTFSKPFGAAMSGLQQQHNEMSRTLSMSSDVGGKNLASGSETERDTRRRTIGVEPFRASLDGAATRRGEGGSGDGQARAPSSTTTTPRRERRRTLTGIFQR